MSECRSDEMELELCFRCKQDMLADGRGVRTLFCGVDRKAKCDTCKRMRYVSRYAVTKGVSR